MLGMDIDTAEISAVQKLAAKHICLRALLIFAGDGFSERLAFLTP